METNLDIESFLRGELSTAERERFLERMETDTEFKKEVLFQKQMMENLDGSSWSYMETYPEAGVREYMALFEDEDIQALKESIGKAKEHYRSKGKVRPLRWIAYAAAASVALWLGTTFFKKESLSSQELYTQYLDLEGLPSLVVRDEGPNNYLVNAQQQFENKDYEAALATFKTQLDTAQRKTSALYLYTGISQMELNQFKAAETTFDALKQSDLVDSEKALWYKALLYLKQDKTIEAKTLLREVVENNLEPYRKKAEGILKELE